LSGQGAFIGGRNARLIVAGWVATLLAVAAPAADRLEVTSLAIAGEGPATRIDLVLGRAPAFELFTLASPDRVVLDLAGTAPGSATPALPAAAGAVRQVRVAPRPGGKLRIVFDLTEPVRPAATATTSGLVLELRPLSAPVDGPPLAAMPTSTPTPTLTPAPPSTAAPPAVAAPTAPAPPVVVVVDAGHGGHDPGALGPSGTREKDVTLAISRKLVALLDAEPGMRGFLTRSDDRFLGLRERMERARSVNASLFISIHADAAQNRSARGSTVYVLSGKGASDEASRRLAARENAALIGGVDLGDKDPVLASVLMDLSQNASISSSIAVGDAVLGQMQRLGQLHRPSVQQAPFMVLKSPDVPSILVETAYISNPTDERRLRSADHQTALARAILAGIKKYFAANPPAAPAGRPAPVLTAGNDSPAPAPRPRQHVVRRGDTLSGVASLYRVSVRSLRAENGLRSDTVRVGQKLRIPRGSS